MIVGILIDFDNIFPKPISEYAVDDIKDVIRKVVKVVLAASPATEKIVIRLYGGWYEGTSPTTRASVITSMIPSLSAMFPIFIAPTTRVRGTIELASQLYGHEYVWYNTYRERPGIPKLRIEHSSLGAVCNTSPDTCPVKIMKKFVDKKTRICKNTGCSTVHSTVFFEKTQKYVDTMIACDIITLSLDADVSSVYVMSDDVDHFPAFAVAHILPGAHAKKGLFIMNDQNEANYRSILAPFKVEVTTIPK